MIRTNLFAPSEVRSIKEQLGCFQILEYNKDVSVSHGSAQTEYFASQMGVKKKQVIANLNGNGVIVQAGAMQLMIGGVEAQTNIQGAGDLMKKMIGARVTGETAVKPQYYGVGTLVLEPTYKHILLEDLANWAGNMVIEDGLFLACDNSVQMNVVARQNLSSAALGGEGLFNTALYGQGVVALESPVPREELIVVDLENDVLKIDGNMAIAWSTGLQFTVERSTKSLLGSAASGEGLVNVYRGTGRVLLAPVTY